MHVLGQYSQEAVALANLKRQSSVLDVACGPGTLSLIAAKKAARVTSIDFSRCMVRIFREQLKQKAIGHVKVYQGDGQALPFKDESFDAAFSMFGLMFFPDRPKGFAELHRTLKPGGRAVVSSWAPVSRSPSMKAMFGALRAMDPRCPEAQEGDQIADRRFSRKCQAGFGDVRILIVKAIPHNVSQRKYWTMMVEAAPDRPHAERRSGKKSGRNGNSAWPPLRRHWPSYQ